MKSLKALEKEDCYFDFEELHVPYMHEDFSKLKVSNAEMKMFQRIFGADVTDQSVGIFPDAVNDAADYRVFDEYEDDNNQQEFDDEEY